MKDQFKEFIYQRVKDLKNHEVQEILSIFMDREISKGTLFKERSSKIKELRFLVKGSARSYFINENGEEITDEIFQKNSFLSDIKSERTGERPPIIIEILEKSTFLVAPMDQVRELLDHNFTFNALMREYMSDRTSELVQRYLMFLNSTAKKRYQYFIDSKPSLLLKFPQKFIASMIGVTPTQLSRIRNARP